MAESGQQGLDRVVPVLNSTSLVIGTSIMPPEAYSAATFTNANVKPGPVPFFAVGISSTSDFWKLDIIFLEAANRMGVNAACCLVIEDSF
ncbi:hypothetical protein AgCh_004956 [Apium graveolens]